MALTFSAITKYFTRLQTTTTTTRVSDMFWGGAILVIVTLTTPTFADFQEYADNG